MSRAVVTASPDETERVQQRSRRRLYIMLALAIFLIGQGAFAFAAAREPYPAVRMPAFGDAPNSAGLFGSTTLDVTIGYEDGSIRRTNVVDIMSGIRYSSMRNSADYVFHPDANRGAVRPIDDPMVRAWLEKQARSIGGGLKPSYVSFCWRESKLDIATARYVDQQPCQITRVDL